MMREKQPPPHAGWVRHPLPSTLERAHSQSVWTLGPIRVISSLVDAESPRGTGETIVQWHVSISDRGRRPKPKQLRRALRAFDMVGAELDNHHPGVAQHFWMPIDPAHRVGCECKESEDVITEADGYTWTNPREDEGACRGCELAESFARIGKFRPCPIHVPELPTAQRR